MTTYPASINERAAKIVKGIHTRLRVHDQRLNSIGTQANNADANIRGVQQNIGSVPSGHTLQGQINAMQQQINNLFTKIGDPNQNGSGLTNAQSTFLATLGQMGNVGHPAPNNLTNTNNQLDTLLNELTSQNYMLP